MKAATEEGAQARALNKRRAEEVERLKGELEAGKSREGDLIRKMEAMDGFRLDQIARELKSIEGELSHAKGMAQGLVQHATKLQGHLDRESTGGYAGALNDALREARSHVKETIQECLNELLKAHIGSATDLHAIENNNTGACQ